MENFSRPSLEKRSSSDSNEKGDLDDIVRVTLTLSWRPNLITAPILQGVLVSDIQAPGPDIIEATEHAKTMTLEEIEDVIDHILLEVCLSRCNNLWRHRRMIMTTARK